MTSSTVSSESAPRSSTNEALGVTSPSSTPNCSTMICLTLSSTAAMFLLAWFRYEIRFEQKRFEQEKRQTKTLRLNTLRRNPPACPGTPIPGPPELNNQAESKN